MPISILRALDAQYASEISLYQRKFDNLYLLQMHLLLEDFSQEILARKE